MGDKFRHINSCQANFDLKLAFRSKHSSDTIITFPVPHPIDSQCRYLRHPFITFPVPHPIDSQCRYLRHPFSIRQSCHHFLFHFSLSVWCSLGLHTACRGCPSQKSCHTLNCTEPPFGCFATPYSIWSSYQFFTIGRKLLLTPRAGKQTTLLKR